jgi:hypothetical protein
MLVIALHNASRALKDAHDAALNAGDPELARFLYDRGVDIMGAIGKVARTPAPTEATS